VTVTALAGIMWDMQLLVATEIAARIGADRSNLYRALRRARLPEHDRDGYVAWSAVDVDNWVSGAWQPPEVDSHGHVVYPPRVCASCDTWLNRWNAGPSCYVCEGALTGSIAAGL